MTDYGQTLRQRMIFRTAKPPRGIIFTLRRTLLAWRTFRRDRCTWALAWLVAGWHA